MRATTAWCLYDVGHSAFATTMMAAVLPVYFSSVAAKGLDADPDQTRVLASSTWGYANTLAMALTAFLAPVLGAVADRGGHRKRLLAFFAFSGSLLSAAVALGGAGDWMLVFALYVLGRICFSGSLVVYDSLLPHVAGPEEVDAVSARGYAWGYLGGGVLLAAQLVVILRPELVGLGGGDVASRWAFVSVGLWWAVFSLPVLRRVPEGRHGEDLLPRPPVVLVRDAFRQLRRTFAEIRRYRDAVRFLVAFWFYNDGIGTIVVMATIFGNEIGLPRSTLLGAILMVQFLGFPFSLAFGRLARRVGARTAILWGLGGYGLICVWGFFLDQAWEFWVLAAMVSMVQGGCQALSRSLFTRLIPPHQSAEFFGFYDVSSKFAGIAGPLVFALVAQLLGSSRWGILALILFFALGAAILRGVDPERAARRLAETSSP